MPDHLFNFVIRPFLRLNHMNFTRFLCLLLLFALECIILESILKLNNKNIKLV